MHRSIRLLFCVIILYNFTVAFGVLETEAEYVKGNLVIRKLNECFAECEQKIKRVAIIGSGIGGSSAAYFLNEKAKAFADRVKYEVTGNINLIEF